MLGDKAGSQGSVTEIIHYYTLKIKLQVPLKCSYELLASSALLLSSSCGQPAEPTQTHITITRDEKV